MTAAPKVKISSFSSSAAFGFLSLFCISLRRLFALFTSAFLASSTDYPPSFLLSFLNGHAGCGTVIFERAEDADKALKELNESQLAGRTIYVKEDKYV